MSGFDKEDDLEGISYNLLNIYSISGFLRFYLDFDVPLADETEIEVLKEREEYKNMAMYPYYGSVQKIDNYIVVKLGEE